MYSHSNQVLLDGSNNMGYINARMNVSPTPETVQEFKLVTNNYSAEYGKVGGAVISMASKAGTNRLPRRCLVLLPRRVLGRQPLLQQSHRPRQAAGRLQDLRRRLRRPDLQEQDLLLRQLRTFHRRLFRSPLSRRCRPWSGGAGDFSVADGPFAQTQLYDPYNVVDGQRVPFPGNIIPASRINPISARLMQLLPIPAAECGRGDRQQLQLRAEPPRSRTNKWSTRVDHHFTGGSTLFGRFSWQETPRRPTPEPSGLPGMLEGVYQQFVEPAGGYNMAGGWVKPFGSSVVSELNVAGWKSRWILSRSIDQENWEEKLGFDTASLYPVTNPDGSRGPGGMPRVSAVGVHGLGTRSGRVAARRLGRRGEVLARLEEGEPLFQVRGRAHPKP